MAIATAMASSKLFPAAVKDSDAVSSYENPSFQERRKDEVNITAK